nr:hypothetical protein [Rhodospirillales bacterium]
MTNSVQATQANIAAYRAANARTLNLQPDYKAKKQVVDGICSTVSSASKATKNGFNSASKATKNGLNNVNDIFETTVQKTCYMPKAVPELTPAEIQEKQFKIMVEVQKNAAAGNSAAVWACVLGVLGIFTIGWFFVPMAALCAICGTLQSISNFNAGGIFRCLIAWAIVLMGFVTSPSLWLSTLAIIGASM